MRYDLIMIEVLLKSPIIKYLPKNVVEIGSRDGHDINTIKNIFSIKDENCFIFEAHPDCYQNIKNTYKNFNVFNCAITDKTGVIKFNAGIVGQEGNIGMSSVLEQNSGGFKSKQVEIDGWRFDEICKQLNLKEIDLVKIDVEGHSLNVLESFGDTIKNTKYIQIELEHVQIWKNQKVYENIKDFLLENNFIEIGFMRHCYSQSDSLWANNNCINK